MVEDVSTQQRGVCLIKYDVRNNQSNQPSRRSAGKTNTPPDTTTSTSIFDSFHFRQQQEIRREQQQRQEQQSAREESTGAANPPMTTNARTDIGTTTASNDPEYYKKMAAFHKNFPIRLVAFHVCYIDPSMIKRNWLSVAVKKFGLNDRAKFRFHHGTCVEFGLKCCSLLLPNPVLFYHAPIYRTSYGMPIRYVCCVEMHFFLCFLLLVAP